MAVHAPSAIGVAQPFLHNYPVPFAASQEDLQDVAFSYAGFAVGVAVTGRISKVLTLFSSPDVLHMFNSPSVLTAGAE